MSHKWVGGSNGWTSLDPSGQCHWWGGSLTGANIFRSEWGSLLEELVKEGG